MYVWLGDRFTYSYSTAAHYNTHLNISPGLKQISDQEFSSDKPGSSIDHVLTVEAVECGLQSIEEITMTRDDMYAKTKTEYVNVISSKCARCHKPTTKICSRCCESYCSKECRSDSRQNGHDARCMGTLIYDASGYLIGTAHHSVIQNGLYTSTGMRSSRMTRMLSADEKETLCKILDQYRDRFHKHSKRDNSPGGDMGRARFIYNGKYAVPEDVPELAKFFLRIDPQLSNSPGGLQ